MNKLKFIVAFIFIINFHYSQNFSFYYDSLKTIKNDSLKVNYIISKIIDPLEDNADFQKAESELAKPKNYINGNKNIDFKINSKFIDLLISQEKFDEANQKIRTLELAAIKLDNIHQQGVCLRLKAQIQLYLGNLSKSSEYYFKALEKFKETKIASMISLSYSDIATLSYYNENYKQAAEYWEKSIELDEVAGRKNIIANNLSNLGLAYIENGNLIKAESSLLKALAISNEINNEAIRASAYINLTKLEYSKKNYKKALEYNNLAAKYYESVKKYSTLSNVYSNGAELARTAKEYQNALKYMNKAFEAINHTENKTYLYSLFLNKAAIHYDLKDYKAAYDNLENYINQKDSVVNIENQKNINDLEKKYQLNERKKENAL
ncbi:MAG: tetratricopeptide repeat protein, partial [Nitrososphaeraceae archaeon]